jgi:3-oxoacyl-[acyl-carrier-protein] synthase-3
MALTKVSGRRIRAIGTCVPARRFDNLTDTSEFAPEVRKVVAMAGVKTRYLADDAICSRVLCLAAARCVL